LNLAISFSTSLGAFPFAMVVGGWLSTRVGPRLAILVGCAIMVYANYLVLNYKRMIKFKGINSPKILEKEDQSFRKYPELNEF
jgi:MFS-type transporter involved in bile tolerance (Atg22 family)